MLQRYEAKVIQKPSQITAKYGRCSVIKLQLLSTNEEIVIFSKENDANVLKRYKGEVVECYQDDKQKWKLLTTIVTRNNGGNGLKPLSDTLSFSTFREESNISNGDDIENIIQDVPMLSNIDKKKIARFIDQQAALYKYTVNAVNKEFPELEGIDDRGIRSIALSLLINTNMVINRNFN